MYYAFVNKVLIRVVVAPMKINILVDFKCSHT